MLSDRFLVKLVVSGSGSNNIRCHKELGISVSNSFYIFNEHIIYFIHDPPPLLKNLRNYFRKFGIANLDIIRFLFQHESNNKGHLLPKLTPNHLNPLPFIDMKVYLAVQLLSQSVANSIRSMYMGISRNDSSNT